MTDLPLHSYPAFVFQLYLKAKPYQFLLACRGRRLTLPGLQAVPWATVAGSDTSSPRWKKVPLQTRSLWLKRTVVVRISALVPSRGRSLPP